MDRVLAYGTLWLGMVAVFTVILVLGWKKEKVRWWEQ